MTILLPELSPNSMHFPAVEQALTSPDGLLAYGGDLGSKRLLEAYYRGIFPWYSQDDPVLWWSPSTRAIITAEGFHIARRLKKVLRQNSFVVTLNHATDKVIRACSQRSDQEGTWITEEMMTAYIALSHQQRCHSVEVWFDNKLVGGLYGVSVGQVFCGESMFSHVSNASKIALTLFQHHFFMAGGQLIDCQIQNPHLLSLGAIDISRPHFLQQLVHYRNERLPDNFYSPRILLSPWSH